MIVHTIKRWQSHKKFAFFQIIAQGIAFIILTLLFHFSWLSLGLCIGSTIFYFYCDYRLDKIGKIAVPAEFSIITKETIRINDRLYQYRIEYALNNNTLGKMHEYIASKMYENKSLADINFDLSEFFVVKREGLHCVQDNSFTVFDELEEEQRILGLELKKNNPVNPIQKLLHLANYSY